MKDKQQLVASVAQESILAARGSVT